MENGPSQRVFKATHLVAKATTIIIHVTMTITTPHDAMMLMVAMVMKDGKDILDLGHGSDIVVGRGHAIEFDHGLGRGHVKKSITCSVKVT